MKPDGSDVKRHSTFEDYDVRWPAMGDGKIVYQHKMDLWVFDLASGKNEQVPIRLPSDRLQVRERFVDPMQYLGNWGISKDGERIALETRGDVFGGRALRQGAQVRKMTGFPLSNRPMITFQDVILRLQAYWGAGGCAILQPYDMEVGAGTSHTATFLRSLGPEPWPGLDFVNKLASEKKEEINKFKLNNFFL